MTKMNTFKTLLLTIPLLFFACSDDDNGNDPSMGKDDDLEITDKELFDLLSPPSATPYYWGGEPTAIHPTKSDGRFHGLRIKVRYNKKVHDMLDENGKAPKDILLPEGSAIVKETYETDGKLLTWSMMYKKSEDKNSNDGWLWAEYDGSGKNTHRGVIALKGQACADCHRETQRDYTRIFVFDPPEANLAKEDPADQDMSKLLLGDEANIYYKGDQDAFFSATPARPHGRNFRRFKLRYNQVIKDALNDEGRLPDDVALPNGALIIKELFDDDGNHSLSAAMYKNTHDTNNGAGWLWYEMDPKDNATVFSVTEKGKGCISCHGSGSGAKNDYIRTFGLSHDPDNTMTTNTDKEIAMLILGDEANIYYKGDKDAFHDATNPSPHGRFKLRYNQVIKDALDDDEKLPDNITLPNGALIVKELFDDNDNPTLSAAMYKNTNDTNNAKGWLWFEMNPKDNATVYSVTKKGGICTSCHGGGSGAKNDYIRTFGLSQDPDNTMAKDPDKEMAMLILGDEASIYYKGDKDAFHDATSPSPHGRFKLRYNQVIKDALNEDEKLPENITLPNGALIVKELFDDNDNPTLSAAMYKNTNDTNNAKGWLWFEMNPKDNATVYSVTKKGGICTSCHGGGSGAKNDYIRIFGL